MRIETIEGRIIGKSMMKNNRLTICVETSNLERFYVYNVSPWFKDDVEGWNVGDIIMVQGRYHKWESQQFIVIHEIYYHTAMKCTLKDRISIIGQRIINEATEPMKLHELIKVMWEADDSIPLREYASVVNTTKNLSELWDYKWCEGKIFHI